MPGIVQHKDDVFDLYQELMLARRGFPVEEALARMLSSWVYGMGSMPAWLGLDEGEFRTMMLFHFPSYPVGFFSGFGKALDFSRMDESEDLRCLLMQSLTGVYDYEAWMADILVAGCLGNDHLWQDMGFWQRADLSRFMRDNFKPLAMRNDRDMKWKKFLYKQLCEAEGIYTCRSPSCEVCVDYPQCFGPEE